MDNLNTKCGGIYDEPTKHILRYTAEQAGEINICKEIQDSLVPPATVGGSGYYLVVNDQPKNEIVVNGEFNGIIFTNGRVTVRNNGKITGCIIAAGRGCEFTGSEATGQTCTVTGSAADYDPATNEPIRMPVIKNLKLGDTTSSNVSLLDSGEFAGVMFDGGNSSVNFSDRDTLLNGIRKDCGIDLSDIF